MVRPSPDSERLLDSKFLGLSYTSGSFLRVAQHKGRDTAMSIAIREGSLACEGGVLVLVGVAIGPKGAHHDGEIEPEAPVLHIVEVM